MWGRPALSEVEWGLFRHSGMHFLSAARTLSVTNEHVRQIYSEMECSSSADNFAGEVCGAGAPARQSKIFKMTCYRCSSDDVRRG